MFTVISLRLESIGGLVSASECLPLELWLQSVTEGEKFVNSVKKGTSLIEEMDLTEPCSACISAVAVAFLLNLTPVKCTLNVKT